MIPVIIGAAALGLGAAILGGDDDKPQQKQDNTNKIDNTEDKKLLAIFDYQPLLAKFDTATINKSVIKR